VVEVSSFLQFRRGWGLVFDGLDVDWKFEVLTVFPRLLASPFDDGSVIALDGFHFFPVWREDCTPTPIV
jgi:hypothetical protein